MSYLTPQEPPEERPEVPSFAFVEEVEADLQEKETHSPSSELAQVRVLLSHLAQEGPRMGRGFMTTAWLLGMPLLGGLFLYSMGNGELPYALLDAFLFATALKMNRQAVSLEQATTALSLSEVNTRWIGPLAEALEWPDPRVQRIAMLLLTRLLPSATVEDGQSLTTDQRAALYARLTPPQAARETELAASVLKMLETTRDPRAIPYVERLADRFAWNSRQHRIREMARRCLPLLEERDREEREAQEQAERERAALHIAVGLPVSRETEEERQKVQGLLEDMEEERRRHQKPGMRLGFLIASWCVIVPYTAWQLVRALANGEWGLSLLWGIFTAFATQLHRLSLSLRQSEMVRHLAQYDSVRGVGPLAEALEWPDAHAQRVVADALTRLLPRMQASDANLLNASQRAILYRQLTMQNANRRADFLCAILRALEQVGDHAAIGPVERLADAQAMTANQRLVKAKAQQCVPYLASRAQQTDFSQTLLRASSSGVATGPELLLRPASSSETPQEQLLRPSTPE